MSVTIALIVKNEEQTLGRCLASIADAVDEIVVVDTGSTDGTKEVAAQFTDRIFDFPWIGDFAAARQFAFDQARAAWVGWLDADDIVRGAEHIRAELAALAPAVGVVHWRYVVAWDGAGNVTCEYWRERLVRTDGVYRWSGKIHEVLIADPPREVARSAQVVVEHHPEAERGVEKLERNIEIMEDAVEASRDNPTSRTLYYLARDLATLGKTRRAITYLQQYLRVANWLDEKYAAHNLLARLYRQDKHYEWAIDITLAALKIHPHWPDAYFSLAETYYYMQDWPKVIFWSDIGRSQPPPDTLLITNPMTYRFDWIIFYTNALYNTGRIQEALDWTRHARSIVPDNEWHVANERYFAEQLGAGRVAAALS